MSSLPSSFDVVVIGTGLTESVLAAACARAGKSVLHLDANLFYGARHATFSLRDFSAWLRGEAAAGEAAQRMDPSAGAPPGDEVAQPDSSQPLRVTHTPHAPRLVSYISGDGTTEPGGVDAAVDAPSGDAPATGAPGDASAPPPELLDRSARFNIDLSPSLIRGGGPMVDAMRSSGVASYLEFQSIALHAYQEADGEGEGEGSGSGGGRSGSSGGGSSSGGGGGGGGGATLRRVPCSKGDIFTSPIPLLEKRKLMKFLQSCAALQPVLEPDAPPPPAQASAT